MCGLIHQVNIYVGIINTSCAMLMVFFLYNLIQGNPQGGYRRNLSSNITRL